MAAEKAKRLYKSNDDKVLAGICGGLGKYFNIDPVFFRVIFIVAFLAGGSSLLAYLILWLAIPAEN